MQCLPSENIVLRPSGMTSTESIRPGSSGWQVALPTTPLEPLPEVTVRLPLPGSYEPLALEQVQVNGNVARISLEFKYSENEEWVVPEKYTYMEGSTRVYLEPPLEVVYVKVIYLAAQPMPSGAIPKYYNTTVTMLGCFVCRKFS